MANNCEMFMKNFISIYKNQIRLLDKEYVRDHRCERTNIAYKSKLSEVANLILNGQNTHVCIVSKVIFINAENKICLLNKKYVSVH